MPDKPFQPFHDEFAKLRKGGDGAPVEEIPYVPETPRFDTSAVTAGKKEAVRKSPPFTPKAEVLAGGLELPKKNWLTITSEAHEAKEEEAERRRLFLEKARSIQSEKPADSPRHEQKNS